VIYWFGAALNSGSFPGNYFIAGMGSQLAFAILIFWFVTRQGRVDDEYSVSE
jgi:putative solute:sodium symporter small subunit